MNYWEVPKLTYILSYLWTGQALHREGISLLSPGTPLPPLTFQWLSLYSTSTRKTDLSLQASAGSFSSPLQHPHILPCMFPSVFLTHYLKQLWEISLNPCNLTHEKVNHFLRKANTTVFADMCVLFTSLIFHNSSSKSEENTKGKKKHNYIFTWPYYINSINMS